MKLSNIQEACELIDIRLKGERKYEDERMRLMQKRMQEAVIMKSSEDEDGRREERRRKRREEKRGRKREKAWYLS